MNELLEALKPINPVTEPQRLMMIEQFQKFMLEYDIEKLNETSFQQYEDGLDYFFHTFKLMPTEREMQVIATVLAWLNSNCGRSFLYEAESMSRLFKNYRYKGYVCAWAYEDKRQIGSNHGFTLLEHLLTPSEHRDLHRGLLCNINQFVSVNDHEIVKCLIQWLSTGDGQSYLDLCKVHGLFYEWYPLNKSEQAVQMKNSFNEVELQEMHKASHEFQKKFEPIIHNLVQQYLKDNQV